MDRLNEFTDMCTFVGTIAKKLNLPFMVAGDFNLDSTLAEELLRRYCLFSVGYLGDTVYFMRVT
jgi:hypothetical protein